MAIMDYEWLKKVYERTNNVFSMIIVSAIIRYVATTNERKEIQVYDVSRQEIVQSYDITDITYSQSMYIVYKIITYRKNSFSVMLLLKKQ